MPHGLCLAGKCTVAGVALLKLGAALGRQSMLCATGSPGTQCPARRQDSPTGAAFSPSSPLLFFLCVTGSLNKPDYCSPLLKNLQCVSVACKMKGRWLVWLTEPPQLLCPRAQLRASRSLRWATFLSAVFFTKPVLNTPSLALLGVISFPLILQRAGRCPPFSDLPGVLSCSSSTLLGTLGGSLVFV